LFGLGGDGSRTSKSGLPLAKAFVLSPPLMMTKTALLFAGQGAQVVGMGKDLADDSPTARALFTQANDVLGYDLANLCFNGPEPELRRTDNAQPAIFLVSWIAYRLLMEHIPGLCVTATAGLSLGEFTALAAAGALSFADGLRTVRARGRFMEEACAASRGGMAAIMGLDEGPTREVCRETGVELANLNCPGQLVISGDIERIERACALAKTRGAKRALPLPVAGAYQSPLMASAQPKLAAILAGWTMQPPVVPVIANVTARPHGPPEEIRASLLAQVTASVRWEESMRYLLAQGCSRFIELGPGTALSGFMKRIDKNALVYNISDGPSLEKTVGGLTAEGAKAADE
jgi:[acyl-carrier-protein] S-malonyltransferase